MKQPRALIFWGGWDGHKPQPTTKILANGLKRKGFDVQVENSLDCLADVEALKKYDLIIPNWTMCKAIPHEGVKALIAAVREGVGLGGIHGGMGDAFRGMVEYEWMCGGIFLSHPHIGDYKVRVVDKFHPIMKDTPPMFDYNSEQYYMLVEPGLHILAETEYVYEGRAFTMPVAWIKTWGKGRVFYSALGHDAPKEFKEHPHVLKMTMRGLLWAANQLKK